MLTLAILCLHFAVSLVLIVFILLHAGKGGGLSDMFGGGSGGLAGGTSAEKTLDRITVITAVMFALSTFFLSLRWT